MAEFEIRTQSGKRIVWEGKDGLEACHRYADAHPGETVIAWRSWPRHGLFIGMREVIEPGHWKFGK